MFYMIYLEINFINTLKFAKWELKASKHPLFCHHNNNHCGLKNTLNQTLVSIQAFPAEISYGTSMSSHIHKNSLPISIKIWIL